MNKKKNRERRIIQKRKSDVQENYNEIVEKIENEYRWESVEIDKVREIHRHIKKLTLNKKSRLRKYMNDLLQNQYNTL